MRVTRLSGALDAYGLADLYLYANRHFSAAKVATLPLFAFERMVKHYRDYRGDGMSPGWIVNEMKRKRVVITSGAYLPTDAQIAAFVAAMGRIEKGDLPGDPTEKPSWTEAYGEGPLAKIPWGTIALAAAGIFALHGFATGLGKGAFK